MVPAIAPPAVTNAPAFSHDQRRQSHEPRLPGPGK